MCQTVTSDPMCAEIWHPIQCELIQYVLGHDIWCNICQKIIFDLIYFKMWYPIQYMPEHDNRFNNHIIIIMNVSHIYNQVTCSSYAIDQK